LLILFNIKFLFLFLSLSKYSTLFGLFLYNLILQHILLFFNLLLFLFLYQYLQLSKTGIHLSDLISEYASRLSNFLDLILFFLVFILDFLLKFRNHLFLTQDHIVEFLYIWVLAVYYKICPSNFFFELFHLLFIFLLLTLLHNLILIVLLFLFLFLHFFLFQGFFFFLFFCIP